jgi:hypothetical protein
MTNNGLGLLQRDLGINFWSAPVGHACMKPPPGFLPCIAASAARIFKKAGRAAGVATENLCAGRSYAVSPYLGEQGRDGRIRKESSTAPFGVNHSNVERFLK